MAFSSSCSLFAGVAIDVKFCKSICVFFLPVWLFPVKGSRAFKRQDLTKKYIQGKIWFITTFGLVILVTLVTASVGYDTIVLNKVIDKSCNVVTLHKTKKRSQQCYHNQ